MKVKLLELEEDHIRFLLTGATIAFANGIRRVCMAEVPCLAIDEIGIYDNTSVLFDEQLALRIGLVPIKAENLEILVRPEECECAGQGCPGCRVDLMLSVEGPGNVYSRDIHFTDPGVTPAFDNIPLVILGEGEKLVVEGYVTKRIGRDHAKWNTGTLCGYKNLPSIEIGDSCTGCGKCILECPKKVLLSSEGGKPKASNTLNCSLCKLCIKVCKAEAMKVTPILDSFILTVESSGGIPAKKLVALASQEIRMRAEEFETKLAELF